MAHDFSPLHIKRIEGKWHINVNLVYLTLDVVTIVGLTRDVIMIVAAYQFLLWLFRHW